MDGLCRKGTVGRRIQSFGAATFRQCRDHLCDNASYPARLAALTAEYGNGLVVQGRDRGARSAVSSTFPTEPSA